MRLQSHQPAKNLEDEFGGELNAAWVGGVGGLSEGGRHRAGGVSGSGSEGRVAASAAQAAGGEEVVARVDEVEGLGDTLKLVAFAEIEGAREPAIDGEAGEALAGVAADHGSGQCAQAL